jgi:2-keto-3-deoxy-L-rhamnonate aldolase RhmA
MNRPRSLVKELESDEPSIGIILQSMSPIMVEALGYTDISYVFVDFQHGSPKVPDIDHIVRAADLNDLPVVARVPRDDFSMITYLLDNGVRGIILPQIEDSDVVREAITHVRYGDGRSIASTSRAARFGDFETEDYIDYVNDEIALIPMVESEAAVENASAIAELEETTAVLIGTGDLSLSLDDETKSDPLAPAVDRIFEACHEQECPVGLPAVTAEDIERYHDDASFLLAGTDVSYAQMKVTETMDQVGR